MYISGYFKLNSNISQTYIEHLSGIFQVYLKISQAFLSHFSGIHRVYLGSISSIISGLSQLFIKHLTNASGPLLKITLYCLSFLQIPCPGNHQYFPNSSACRILTLGNGTVVQQVKKAHYSTTSPLGGWVVR